MKSSGIISSNYQISDGVLAPSCELQAGRTSYLFGMLAGAVGALYAATQERAFLVDATGIFNAGMATYSKQDIFVDACEPNCPLDQVSPKGTAILGLIYLYRTCGDSNLRQSIQKLFDASASTMLPKCNDAGQCPNYWHGANPGTLSFHTELNALALMTAVSVVHDAKYANEIVAPANIPVIKTVEPTNSARVFRAALIQFLPIIMVI